MSKFKSFAQQGSFRDYQIQAPDQTGKIKEETARTLRGKERAQNFLERNQALYLQAQKLAQGVEENQREQNFRLETENRKAFRDALTRDYDIQTQNDRIQAKQAQDTFKQISAFAPTAFKLYNELEFQDLERNRKINAQLAYTAGADYNTVVAIQNLGNNLTKSEFEQTDFIRKKLAEGGNIDALFALYERRASKAFINNVAVAQNTAYGYHDAAQIEINRFIEEYGANNNGAVPTITEQRVNLQAFEKEYAASFVGEDGRGLNADMLNSYVYPIMRRSQTQFNSNFDKQYRKEQESTVKQNHFKAINHAWSTGKSASVVEWLSTNASKDKFEVFAEWVTNKSVDFSASGLSVRDIENLRDYQFKGVNGEATTYGLTRGSLSDGAMFNQALNSRIRAEKQNARDLETEAKREAQSNGIELYNQRAADGSISREDYEESLALDRQSGIPGFESEATKLMAKELDSVRFDAAYTQLFDDKLSKGTMTMQDLDQKGVSFAVKQKYAPLIEKQNVLLNDQAYKDGVTAIGNAITEYPTVAKGRTGNKDHYSTILFKSEQLQQFKKDVLNGMPIADAVAGRLGIISSKQATPGAIDSKGHYTSAIQSQAEGAVNYQEALQEDKNFISGSLKPDFRKDASFAVNVYGQDDFYKDYYPMQRGEVTPQLKRRAAIMGVSPLAAINFLASGLGQPAVALDVQAQAIADRITPITGHLLNNYRTNERTKRANAMSTPNGVALSLGEGDVKKFRNAIITQESQGSYTVVNQDSGAIGIGQVMPENVGPWTLRYLGVEMTPEEFRYNPGAQDAVLNGRFNDMFEDQRAAGYQGEELIRRAAAVWYSGQADLWNNPTPQYSNGRRYPSIQEYTQSIWNKFKSGN